MSSAPVGRRVTRGGVLSYGEGRVCADAGCATLLSRYNSTAHCAVHGEARPSSPPARG